MSDDRLVADLGRLWSAATVDFADMVDGTHEAARRLAGLTEIEGAFRDQPFERTGTDWTETCQQFRLVLAVSRRDLEAAAEALRHVVAGYADTDASVAERLPQVREVRVPAAHPPAGW